MIRTVAIRSALAGILILAVSACGIGSTPEERLGRADELAAAGDLTGAIIEAKNALQDDPVNLQARIALARFSLEAGDYGTAAKEFGRAIELGTPVDDIRYQYLQALVESTDNQIADQIATDAGDSLSGPEMVLHGRALVGMRRPEDATAVYQRASNMTGGEAGSHIGLAELAGWEARVEEAVAELDQVPEAERNSVRYLEVSGLVAMRSGDPATATDVFSRAVDAAQPDPFGVRAFPLRGRLAEAALASGDLDRARAVTRRLLAQAPNHAMPNFIMARIEMQAGNAEQALVHAQAALVSKPDWATGRTLAGAASLAVGNAGQAESYLAPVVADEPDNETARRLLARARLTLGRSEDALEVLGPLTEMGADDPATLGLMTEASLQAGRSDDAIAALRQQLEKDPDNEGLRFYLAYTLVQSGDPETAIAMLESGDYEGQSRVQRDFLVLAALIQDDDLDAARAKAGEIVSYSGEQPERLGLIAAGFASEGYLDDARGYYESLLARDPDGTVAPRGLGRLNATEGNLDAAAEWMDKAIALAPDDATLYMDRARIAAAARDRVAYGRFLERARQIDGNSLEARQLLAQHYFLIGQADLAREAALEALAISATDAQSLNVLGLVQLQEGEATAAEASFEGAVAQNPGSAVVRFNLARAKAARGETETARKTLEEAVRLDPSAMLPAAGLVYLEIRSGELVLAEREWKKLAAHHPDENITKLLRADLDLANGNFAEAEEGYLALPANRRTVYGVFRARSGAGRDDAVAPLEGWLEQNPDDAAARIVLGQTLARNGRAPEAIAHYEAVLTQAPDAPAVLNNLAWLYMETGDPRAVATAERALELAPRSPAIMDTTGWILHLAGDSGRALPLLQNAVDLAGGNPEIRYHLAVVLAESGDQAEAARVARSLLADMSAVTVHERVQTLLDDIDGGGNGR